MGALGYDGNDGPAGRLQSLLPDAVHNTEEETALESVEVQARIGSQRISWK
jgi:hypothetical protein